MRCWSLSFRIESFVAAAASIASAIRCESCVATSHVSMIAASIASHVSMIADDVLREHAPEEAGTGGRRDRSARVAVRLRLLVDHARLHRLPHRRLCVTHRLTVCRLHWGLVGARHLDGRRVVPVNRFPLDSFATPEKNDGDDNDAKDKAD